MSIIHRVGTIAGALALGAVLATAPAEAYTTAEHTRDRSRLEYLAYSSVAAAGGPVTLEYDSATLPTDGAYGLTVRTDLPSEASYHEVRLRVFRPSGGVLIQKTEISHDVNAGSHVTTFTRDLAQLRLPPGRYPVQVRVRSQLADSAVTEHTVEDRILLYSRAGPEVPVAVILRFSCAPILDPQGRFVLDPSLHVESRDAAAELAGFMNSQTGLRLSLGIPPVLLDEWSRAANDHEISGPAGIRRVSRRSPSALTYANTLDALGRAARSEHVELLDVPYADPDIAGLQRLDGLNDLAAHYSLGRSTYVRTLATTPSAGTLFFDNRLPKGALAPLKPTGVTYAAVASASLTVQERRSGAYAVEGGVIGALVIDETASRALSSGDTTGIPLLDRVFQRLESSQPTTPLVAVVTLGPGEPATASGIERALAPVLAAPWARTVTALEATRMRRGRPVALPPRLNTDTRTPSAYWEDVALARTNARALASVLETDDPDAASAIWAMMIAESGCWAGPDRSWSLADRGRTFAAAAVRHARGFLDAVTVTGKDVTLSGQRGDVPLSVFNGSPKKMRVGVGIANGAKDSGSAPDRAIVLEPGENLLTIPVDLRSALSDQLRVSIIADDIVLDETVVRVRASYLDRVAVVAAVAIALLGMLVYIRRRVIAADIKPRPIQDDEQGSGT